MALDLLSALFLMCIYYVVWKKYNPDKTFKDEKILYDTAITYIYATIFFDILYVLIQIILYRELIWIFMYYVNNFFSSIFAKS